MGNLATPLSVQKLQTALHAKAKEDPSFRFYALYDKLYRADILQYAYACCKANQGAAGVDEERFEDIEAYGLDRWLGELAQELRSKTYQPQAVRRVFIPKQSGTGLRPLSIPPIRDRVAQTAAKLVLRADLRSRPATRATRLSARARRAQRGQAGAQPAEHGSHAGHRRGSFRVL